MTENSSARFHQGVWLAGIIGFVTYLAWSYALGLAVNAQVGAYNDFWVSLHLGFTMVTALPVAVACACLWARRVHGVPRNYAIFSGAALCSALFVSANTLQPGLSHWFSIADCVALMLGPLTLFTAAAAISTGSRQVAPNDSFANECESK